MSRQPKVFITSAGSAHETTFYIAQELKAQNIDVLFDEYSLDVGREISSILFQAVESSDYVVLLLTPDISRRRWLREELKYTMTQAFRQRDVAIIPVLVGKVRVPPDLAELTRFRISNHREPHQDVKKLVDYIQCIDRVDFNHLDAYSFEEMVCHLLNRMRFKEIESSTLFDRGYDIRAQSEHRDPFGGKIVHEWIFELKHYKHERADLGALRQLSAYLADSPTGTHGVLVTSGQLTSATHEWVNKVRKSELRPLKIIDGPELRNLVARHTEIVDRFFPKKGSEA